MSQMKDIPIKKYIRFLFGIAILVFFLNKFYLRPWVLANELPEFFQILVLSIPNLSEAIVGTLISTGILLHLRQYFRKKMSITNDTIVYIIAVSIAGIYVLSQEFKFHNLGGNNVYDFYDVVASIIGLSLTFGLILIYGFIDEPKPKMLDR